MASMGVNYILGRTLAERQGVTDEAGKNVVSVMLMGLGLTPIGVLLARQIAIQRAEVTPAPAGTGAAERRVVVEVVQADVVDHGPARARLGDELPGSLAVSCEDVQHERLVERRDARGGLGGRGPGQDR